MTNMHCGVETSGIRRWRQNNGASLRDVAALSGLSPAMLSQVENGRRTLSPRSKIRLARALGVPLAELFTPEPKVAA